MKLHYGRILKLSLLSFLMFIFLLNTQAAAAQTPKLSMDFNKLIYEQNLSLTIYYVSPFKLTRAPIKTKDLENGWFEYKIIVQNYRLENYMNLLNSLNKAKFTPVKKKSYENLRIYYVFETKKKKLLSVGMWGNDNSMFINGYEVVENKTLYDIVMPFLPKDAANELQKYLRESK
ncbi:MAG: hypothetical protein Q8880_11570 [Bacteroidota bacterium]|nr:hypothetical protein [Bacteroidota bacterium]